MSTLSQYTGFLLSLGNKEINLNSDSFKIMLVGSSYTPDKSHRYLSAVSGEISGTGYTSGGKVLTNISFKVNADGSTYTWKADSVTYENLTADSIRYSVVYDNTPSSAGQKPLIAYFDFGKNLNVSCADVTIAWNDKGIITITV